MLLDHRILMVHIMIYIVWMRRIFIEPRVVGGCPVAVPPHFRPWMRSCRMVVNHIDNNCKASCVALVNEFLVLLARTIIFVKGEPMVRIVSPAEIAVKLLDRHELHGCHSKVLDVVELRHCTCDVLRSGEVTEKHLIDHQVILILYLEILMLPRVCRLVDPEC